MAAKFLKVCSGGCGRERVPGPDFFTEKATGRPRPRCKHCMTKDSQAWNKRNRAKHVEIYRRANHRANLKRRFGITEERYNELAAAHGAVCGICQKPESRDRKLSLDHCHKTGAIRGFLCCRCNLMIGGFADDPELLERAASYLRNPPVQGGSNATADASSDKGC